MAYSYYNAEKKADMELREKRKKEKVKMLEDIILSLIEDTLQDGLTEEQMFLINYYGLDKQEIPQKKFDISNVEQVIYMKSKMPREQLETNRYNELIDMYSAVEEFNGEEINGYNDTFHRNIKVWDDYTKDFEQDPLIVKKMRNLQMLNKMAHKYEYLFKSILSKKNPQIYEDYKKEDIKRIEYNIGEMFSAIKSDAENAEQRLIREFGTTNVNEWKNNKAIKYCINASKWMFKQKDRYLVEILQDLQNTNEEYNYGVLQDAFVFDVPEYGQFSIQMGKNNMAKVEALKQSYDVKDYKGDYLGNVYILSKADPELLKDVNYEELSDLDKQRYKIACQKTKEQTIEEKDSNDLDNLIQGAKDKERAVEIVNVLREAGLEPEKVVTKTLLDKGQPDAIKDVIEVISHNDYGIGLDILTRCKTLLSVSQNKAIDVMEMLDKINKLGIDSNIITEYPNFLTVSKSDKLEPIYEVLKQYKIDLTNHNIAVAFEGTPQNIKKNMDLVIENGLYDLAKAGVNKFFTSNNKNLNMRINLLKQQNVPLASEREGKRKINATLFKTERDLMEMYGIDKKEILEELSRVKGQDLIQDSKYYVEKENGETVLSDEQQEMSNNIYEKLNKNQLEEDLVIKIGDYFYSAIKVKEQINSIIANLNIQDLKNENVDEILKIALFKGKNINQKEIDEVSEQIESLTKEEIVQEEVREEKIANEMNEQQELQLFEDDEQVIQDEEIENNEQHEERSELNEDNLEYEEIRKMTSDIVEKQQNIETIEQIIVHLKETRKTLKHQIKEMEEKINKSILDNNEPTSEVIQDIKKMREILKLQKEKRKEVKQMIKRYKENKKVMKYTLKQEKDARDSAVDDLEL